MKLDIRYFISIIFGLWALLTLSTCKKYEQDDRRYLKTPCGRIARTWELQEVISLKGKDLSDSLFYYQIPGNGWATLPEQSYTYRGLRMKFEKGFFCTKPVAKVTVLNRPFSSGNCNSDGTTDSQIKLDVRMHESSPSRYFIGVYEIKKLTKDEFIIEGGLNKFYFKAVK